MDTLLNHPRLTVRREGAERPGYSAIIPFYDEEAAVEPLLAEFRIVLETLAAPYEVLLINDGSRDATGATLDRIASEWPACRVLHLPENRGQAAALWAGFQEARGHWLITMDGDGQNVPADIPALIAASEDHDMVVGIRATRRDNASRRFISRLANTVRDRFLGDRMADSGCALKVFRREVVEAFLPIRSLYSFMPAFAASAGFRLAEVPVQHRERRTGRSHYSFGVFGWKPAADMLAIWWFARRRMPFRPTRQPEDRVPSLTGPSSGSGRDEDRRPAGTRA